MNEIMMPAIFEDFGAVQVANGLQIQSDMEAQIASDMIGQIAQKKKQMEAFKDELIRPQKRILADLEAKCRDTLKPFLEADAILRKKLGEYMDAKRAEEKRKAEEMRLKLLEEQKARLAQIEKEAFIAGEKNDMAPLVEASVKTLEKFDVNDIRQTIRTTDTTVNQQLVWVWEVNDFEKIPKEYLIVDEKKLNLLAKSNGSEHKHIPGITFKQITRVGVSRAK